MLIILNYIKSVFISTESVKLHYSFIYIMYNAYLRPWSYTAFVVFGFNAEQSEAKVLLFGFYIMKNAVVANEVSNGFVMVLRFCIWF